VELEKRKKEAVGVGGWKVERTGDAGVGADSTRKRTDDGFREVEREVGVDCATRACPSGGREEERAKSTEQEKRRRIEEGEGEGERKEGKVGREKDSTPFLLLPLKPPFRDWSACLPRAPLSHLLAISVQKLNEPKTKQLFAVLLLLRGKSSHSLGK